MDINDDDEEETPCLYPHFMCANDTPIVRRVFKDTRDVIVQTAVTSLTLV